MALWSRMTRMLRVAWSALWWRLVLRSRIAPLSGMAAWFRVAPMARMVWLALWSWSRMALWCWFALWSRIALLSGMVRETWSTL